MKKIISSIGVLLLVISGYLYFFFQNSCGGYMCLAFDNKKQFREVEQIENSKMSYKGVLTYKSLRIRLEAYDASSIDIAERFSQAKIMQLQGLFENARSPYPGVLSNEVVCENRFKPVIKNITVDDKKITTIDGFLNDRLQYGVCLENQLTHKGKTAMFYCESQKKWYYFEVISKKSDTNLNTEINHLIQSLKCLNPF